MVRLQRSKSIDVLAETALVLRRHEFEEKYFAFLEGKQAWTFKWLPVLCVQWGGKEDSLMRPV